jgi:hypothetical protein
MYGSDTRPLARNVAQYLLQGAERGDALLILAGKDHCNEFLCELEALGADPHDLIRSGQLVTLDAEETLASFMVDGTPDDELFDSNVGNVVRELRKRSDSGDIRAYGEMVGVLWSAGSFSAAMVLEHMWNRLLESTAFDLFCAYPIDIFGRNFHVCDMDALTSSHTDFVRSERNTDLENAIGQAMDELLGERADELRHRIRDDIRLPWAANLQAEALILALRRNLCDAADPILSRARDIYHAAAHA